MVRSEILLLAHWALGLWLESYDKWIVNRGASKAHKLYRKAALFSRARGLLAHDRLLTDQYRRK